MISNDLKFAMFNAVKLFTIMFLFGQLLVLMHTWFIAFFHGDRVMVYINMAGERDLELLMWFVVTPIIASGTAGIVMDVWKEGRTGFGKKRWRRAIGAQKKTEWL